VSPISVALAAAAGVMVVGWLVLVTARRILSRTGRQSTAAGQPTVLEANGGREDWIYGDRGPAERAGRARATSGAEALSDDAKREAAEILARARSEGEAIQDSARGKAEAIVQAAELKAGEALVEVERARGRLEREVQRVAREQALMTAKHKKLSDLLLTALEEIERASANGSTNVRDLGGLQEELRDTLRGTEERIEDRSSPESIPAKEAGSPDERTE
jgi:F0F1-type ATP synthase membrane subunit b/b'